MEELNKTIESLGMIPISTTSSKEKILVIDINVLPLDLKNLDLKDLRIILKNDYGYKVFLIDLSRQNRQGGVNYNNNQHIFFI